MAIGVSSFWTLQNLVALLALTPVALGLSLQADDQITKTDGSVLTGKIVSVSGGQVFVESHASNGSLVKLPYYLTDIKSVAMATPDAVTQIQKADPATVIATLDPLIKQFAGLPSDWVIAAMVQLAQAYVAAGQGDQAADIYNQINQLYPNSAYQREAIAGQASMKLKEGKLDEALAAVQPIVDDANKNLAPSATEGGLYANAFLVYGQILEAQNKFPQALEAYLTVKTMFYQNPASVEQAGQLAQKLRDKNPGLAVE